MAQDNSAIADAGDEVLEIVRLFDAPRDLVFKLWSAPEHIVRWWGPEGLYLSHCEMDFRVGGKWRFCMQLGTDRQHWIGGSYREISPPSRLVFTYTGDEDGHETVVQLDFLARGDGTEMRFRQSAVPTVEIRESMRWGWGSTFNLLNAYAVAVASAGGAPVGQPRAPGRV